MSVAVTVTLDTAAFEAWTAKATAQLAKNLRSAVNTSARAARRATIIAIAEDSGVPASRFRKGTPLVSGATTGSLTARWTVSGRGTGNMLRAQGGNSVPAKIKHGSDYVGSTFRQTGGGSNPLVAKAFVVLGRSGNRLVVVRTGKGRGDWKPLYAEGPGTAMRQVNSVPRRTWERVARAQLSERAPLAVAKALGLVDFSEGIVSDVVHDGDQQ